MQLTPENSLSIQTFLCDGGFIQEAPSEYWSPHKLSGYKTYLESKNLQYTHDPEPNSIESLPQELQAYVSIPDNVKVDKESSEEEDDNNLDSEENTESPENKEPENNTENTSADNEPSKENVTTENAVDAPVAENTDGRISLESPVDKTVPLKVDTKKLNTKK